jgi:hypothetical protein
MQMTREQLQFEIKEKSRDLEVFTQARSLIRGRVLEVADSQSPLTPLPHWSGTDAVLGSLDLSISAIARTVEELQAELENLPEERPTLRLISRMENE